MKNHISIAFCLLISVLSLAQPASFTLTGSIKVFTGEVFPYKIVFSEAGGTIKGYSLTFREPDQTKTTITGTLDRHKRTLSFKETDILYSHDVRTKAFMCLVNAHTEYVSEDGNRVLKGPITSVEADNTSCTGGAVTFSNTAELKALFEPGAQVDEVINMKSKSRSTPAGKPTTAAVPDKELPTEKITTGVEKALDWYSDTVIIDLWDGGNIDGDQVTLQYNGTPLLSGYSLARQKKQLRIPVSGKGVDVIAIVADNEGSDPPNTANLLLTDGQRQYSILSYNNKGQVSMIRLRKAR